MLTRARTVCLALGPLLATLLAAPAGPLAQAQRSGPLILVSLDGFRWDYLERPEARTVRALAARGVRAEALVPAFPSKTFPNHYTMVTGLYPGRHGIVGNEILDVPTGRRFAMSKPDEVGDSMWWGGEPIWVTAERAGLRTATMFWPGSEAAIGGVRPTHWRVYDGAVTGEARVDQVLRWLDEPEQTRPAFITLYFEDADSEGHRSGPDSAAMRQAVERLDGYVDRLLRGLERRDLLARTNLVIVSDHGMAAVLDNQVLELDDYISLADVDVVDINPTLGIFPKPGQESLVLEALQRASPRLKVYAKHETPPQWRFREHARIPPIVGVVDEGWAIVREASSGRPARGAHGYDPSARSMHGVFVAAGPAFRRGGVVVPPFENVHLYNVLARILGVEPAPNDGDPAVAGMMLTP